MIVDWDEQNETKPKIEEDSNDQVMEGNFQNQLGSSIGLNVKSETDQDDHKMTQVLDKIISENQIEEAVNEEEDLENEEVQHINNIESTLNQPHHKKERVGFTRLPVSKIKNIMKLDGDIKLCQKNAYYVVGKLTELFLQELASHSLSVSKINKRKTMNLEDIACAVKSIEKYNFIDVRTIFNVETVEDLKAKEEKFEKKIRQAEIKVDKKDKKDPKIEKVNNKKNISAGNMKIDKMFFGGSNN